MIWTFKRFFPRNFSKEVTNEKMKLIINGILSRKFILFDMRLEMSTDKILFVRPKTEENFFEYPRTKIKGRTSGPNVRLLSRVQFYFVENFFFLLFPFEFCAKNSRTSQKSTKKIWSSEKIRTKNVRSGRPIFHFGFWTIVSDVRIFNSVLWNMDVRILDFVRVRWHFYLR